jgi:uncharacterized damage-inducible protein DinB
MAGEDKRTPMIQVLGHVFNHQTHHRGQVHALLSGTSVAPPSLDLIYLGWDPDLARLDLGDSALRDSPARR